MLRPNNINTMSNSRFKIISKVFELIPTKGGLSSRKLIQKYAPWPALTHQEVEAAVDYLIEKDLISISKPLNEKGIYFDIFLSETGKEVRKMDGGFDEFWRQHQEVSEVNYYLIVLEHLERFEGDGKYYRVDGLLDDYLDNSGRKSVIKGLVEQKYVDLRPGTGVVPFVRMVASFGPGGAIYNDSPRAEFKPHEIRINEKGIDYINKKRMTNKQNVQNVILQNSNFVYESPGATASINIDQKQGEWIEMIRHIIATLKEDQSISKEIRLENQLFFAELIDHIREGNVDESLVEKILPTSDQIASIGSFALTLYSAMMPK